MFSDRTVVGLTGWSQRHRKGSAAAEDAAHGRQRRGKYLAFPSLVPFCLLSLVKLSRKPVDSESPGKCEKCSQSVGVSPTVTQSRGRGKIDLGAWTGPKSFREILLLLVGEP